jgi:hypothetical protein
MGCKSVEDAAHMIEPGRIYNKILPVNETFDSIDYFVLVSDVFEFESRCRIAANIISPDGEPSASALIRYWSWNKPDQHRFVSNSDIESFRLVDVEEAFVIQLTYFS